ncbi:MAG: lipooligosaccharide transport system permease protein [Pseudonocardiales bacterium]|jgi:lipooligosaccharide transport system permease protein|nr:lipooligosaccharide transport system permease protein [Pseudonocardiales bacterium]
MSRLELAGPPAPLGAGYPPRRGLLLRILPPSVYAGRATVLMERSARVYRRAWLIIVSGFFEPLFYLLSFGTGLGTLVGGVSGPHGQALTYAQYIAPALLASSAMNGALNDSMMNVFFKLKYAKLYDGMLATSLAPMDIALGEMSWALTRGGMYTVAFVLVMLAMGLILSPWALLLVPAALLIAFGFAALGMGVTTYVRNWQDIEVVTLFILPMFLFSGTFYSLDRYPGWLRLVVQCLPLHHGVAVMRALTYGDISAGLALHLLYFVAMIAIGLWVTTRRLATLLMT